jgi:hypothetical protein
MIYEHIHSEQVMNNIISMNPFRERYNNNDDLFIHIRLTDVRHLNPGLNYYLNQIRNIKFNNLFIATDQINHPIISQIIRNYPKTKIVNADEIRTFQFGSTCKNIVLSHGTFSSNIGYLAFFSTIYYPEIDEAKNWHGDLFSIDGWIKCNVK